MGRQRPANVVGWKPTNMTSDTKSIIGTIVGTALLLAGILGGMLYNQNTRFDDLRRSVSERMDVTDNNLNARIDDLRSDLGDRIDQGQANLSHRMDQGQADLLCFHTNSAAKRSESWPEHRRARAGECHDETDIVARSCDSRTIPTGFRG